MNIKRQGKRNKKKNNGFQREQGYISGLGRTADIILSVVLILISLLALLPVILVIIISFSSEEAIIESGYSFFPEELSLDAYRYLSGHLGKILQSLGVTLLVTVIGTVLSLFLISTMAYALSRKDFLLRKLYTAIVVIPIFFGGGIASSYAVNTQFLGLKNSIWALILIPACSSWYIIVMRTYFLNNIPPEILEAARLDGASAARIFFRFVIPLSKPIMITVGLFEAFSYWNSWYENLLYTDSNHSGLYTLQYVLYNMEKNVSFLTSGDSISGLSAARVPTESFRMALVVVIILPILVTYPMFGRHIKNGLNAGAGK